MKRQVWGVIAATVTAPYLSGLMMSLLIELSDVVSYGESFDVLDVLKFLPLSTFALAFIGIPLLIIAGVVAALLNLLGCRTKWPPILAGIILGSCSLAVISVPSSFDDWLMILIMSSLPGAVCGWIYWRIALKSHVVATVDPA